MEKSRRWNAVRSMLFPPPWMSSYEEGLACNPQRDSVDFQRLAFLPGGASARIPGGFSGSPQTRWAAARSLQTHRLFVVGASRSHPFRGVRRQPDVLFL